MSRARSTKLPTIEHPLAKVASSLDAEKLDVRGSEHLTDPIVAGRRPLASERGPRRVSRGSQSSRASTQRSLRQLKASSESNGAPPQRHPIPEGVPAVQGDAEVTRLPVFGVRTQAAEAAFSRAKAPDSSQSRRSASSQLSNVQAARLEMDEIEAAIRLRVRSNYFEMRKRFIDNDPEHNGNVSRDALLRIVVSAVGRPVSHAHLSQLFQRIGLRQDKQIINFVEFFSALREASDEEYPNWMDTVQRQRLQHGSQMSAAQVHADLTGRMRQRFADLADVFPQLIDGGTGRILKHELRSSLNKMHLLMTDDEFERLWRMYDPKNTGTVNGVNMLRKMGIIMQNARQANGSNADKQEGKVRAKGNLLKAEEDRKRSLTMESWLKDKFREGFKQLKAEFEALDPERTGLVGHDAFLSVLNQHSLSLQRHHLPEFLARCAVPLTKAGVMYRDFLHRFQDRSEAGMTHKIMANPHHAKEDDTVAKEFSNMESQLMTFFQRDFLSLLAAFQKIDRHSQGAISQEEFRAVMESRFGFELTDQQFKEFVNHLPLNSRGLVRYDIFMRQFDTKGMAPSLFRSEPSDVASDIGTVEEEEDENEFSDANMRTLTQTRRCIAEVLHDRFQQVEAAFYNIDEYNSGRLTQEMMYQMLKDIIQPSLSRGEIRNLWKIFYLRDGESLDYQEFLRAFIHNASTGAFPNAKLCPPKRGDADCMMRSRKVNSDVNLLEDGLRAKVDYLWDKLRDEFIEMDPYGTGCVSKVEFQAVLKELCVQLTDHELDKLTAKFTRKHDQRVNYVELLRPFAFRNSRPRRNHMHEVLHHPQQNQEASQRAGKAMVKVTAKLRKELAGDWQKLQRQFRKVDNDKSGCVSIDQFSSVLKNFNVVINEEEAFELLSEFDSELKGQIPFTKFIAVAKQTKKSH